MILQGVNDDEILFLIKEADPPALQATTNENHMCWRVEFDVCCHLKEESIDAEATRLLLATAGKKQRTEVLKCRWVLTRKPLDPIDAKGQGRDYKPKARLVILGYLELELTEIPRDSPTLNKTSRMLLLQMVASHGWDLLSFDIKAAFLQGKPQSNRTLAIEPPEEFKRITQLRPNESLKLEKGAYGLIDAPYQRFCALMHVDDGIGGGSPRFLNVVAELEKRFPLSQRKVGRSPSPE